MSCQDISAGLFSAGEHALTFRESFNAKFYDKAEKIPRMIVNVIVTQHHRRPSTQTGLLEMVLGRFGCFFFFVDIGGFGWFWVGLSGFAWFHVLVTTPRQAD